MSESTDTGSTAQERLVTALADMEQWEDVWMELYVRGVTGYRSAPLGCPVSNYLSDVVGDLVGVDTDDCQIGHRSATRVPTPPNVTAFICEFDWNRYPELESA